MPESRSARRMPRPRDVETIRDLLRSGEGSRALQCIGDRWSFLLLRDAFLGVRRFEDLRRLTGASRGTLTARLNALVEQGILYRSPYGNAPSRLEYRLTEKGKALNSVLMALLVWGDRTFLTTKGYNLFILDRDTFVPLDEGAARMASTWENCRGLGVMQGRIVATLNQGFLGEWSPETSYCPLRTPQAQDGGQRALTIQHRLVTVDSQSRTAAQHVVWFSADTPEACR